MKTTPILKISKVNYQNDRPFSVIISGLNKDIESEIYVNDYKGITWLDIKSFKKLWTVYKNQFHKGLKISSTIHRSGILGKDSVYLKITDKQGDSVSEEIFEEIGNLGQEVFGYEPNPWGTKEFQVKKFLYDVQGNRYLLSGSINIVK